MNLQKNLHSTYKSVMVKTRHGLPRFVGNETKQHMLNSVQLLLLFNRVWRPHYGPYCFRTFTNFLAWFALRRLMYYFICETLCLLLYYVDKIARFTELTVGSTTPFSKLIVEKILILTELIVDKILLFI